MDEKILSEEEAESYGIQRKPQGKVQFDEDWTEGLEWDFPQEIQIIQIEKNKNV